MTTGNRVKVFRFETVTGRGIYADGSSYISHDTYSKYSSRVRPCPYSDGMTFSSSIHYFGFASLDQLKKWFTVRDRKSFKFHGCELKVYEIETSKVVYGKRQVAFHKEKADLICSLDPVTFEEIRNEDKSTTQTFQTKRKEKSRKASVL